MYFGGKQWWWCGTSDDDVGGGCFSFAAGRLLCLSVFAGVGAAFKPASTFEFGCRFVANCQLYVFLTIADRSYGRETAARPHRLQCSNSSKLEKRMNAGYTAGVASKHEKKKKKKETHHTTQAALLAALVPRGVPVPSPQSRELFFVCVAAFLLFLPCCAVPCCARARRHSRVRKFKQKFAMTDVRKEANRMGFASMADEYSDTAMGLDFGMLGEPQPAPLTDGSLADQCNCVLPLSVPSCPCLSSARFLCSRPPLCCVVYS